MGLSTSFREVGYEPRSLRLNDQQQKAALHRSESVHFKERLKDMKNRVAAKDIELWSIKDEMDKQNEDLRVMRKEVETYRTGLKRLGASTGMLRSMSMTLNSSISRTPSKGVRFESAEKEASIVKRSIGSYMRDSFEALDVISKPSWKDRSMTMRDTTGQFVEDFLKDIFAFVETEQLDPRGSSVLR